MMKQNIKMFIIIILIVISLSFGLFLIFKKDTNPEKEYARLEERLCNLTIAMSEKYPETINIDKDTIGSYSYVTFATISGLSLLEDGEKIPIYIENPLVSTEEDIEYFSDTTRIKLYVDENNHIKCDGFVDIGNPPKITLIGGEKIALTKGEEYKEPGYNAEDDEDGDLTSDVIKNGVVDPEQEGEYTLLYFVTDSTSNTVSKIRTVTVK